MATWEDVSNEPCGVCGKPGWGWSCTFDHTFMDFPGLIGLS